jgi:anti-sigma regulatory factor (Ser/Thr protein kinase)
MTGTGPSAEPLRLEIPGGVHAPAAARSAITERFEGDLAPARMEELRLLVTELVANSVRHGGVGEGGRVFVEVALSADRARVVVSDGGLQGDPTLRPPDLGGGGGFGLYLVDRVALAWGAEHDSGLRVWFELARS